MTPSIKDMMIGKAPRKRRNKRAMVCIDYANWRRPLGDSKTEIDWRQFKWLMGELYQEVELFYYDGMVTSEFCKHNNPRICFDEIQNIKSSKHQHFQGLKALNYKVITKPMSSIHSPDHKVHFKCNFDVEMTMDIIENLPNFDVLVLCSGDGDFSALARRLKDRHKEVHVISVRGRTNAHLMKAANHFDELEKLLFWVKDLAKKEPYRSR